jgi:hypothetical protein
MQQQKPQHKGCCMHGQQQYIAVLGSSLQGGLRELTASNAHLQ